MGTSKQDYQHLLRNQKNANKPQRRKKNKSKRKLDICSYCQFEIQGAPVTSLNKPGKYHGRCANV